MDGREFGRLEDGFVGRVLGLVDGRVLGLEDGLVDGRELGRDDGRAPLGFLDFDIVGPRLPPRFEVLPRVEEPRPEKPPDECAPFPLAPPRPRARACVSKTGPNTRRSTTVITKRFIVGLLLQRLPR